jgi:hypothetical protein
MPTSLNAFLCVSVCSTVSSGWVLPSPSLGVPIKCFTSNTCLAVIANKKGGGRRFTEGRGGGGLGKQQEMVIPTNENDLIMTEKKILTLENKWIMMRVRLKPSCRLRFYNSVSR